MDWFRAKSIGALWRLAGRTAMAIAAVVSGLGVVASLAGEVEVVAVKIHDMGDNSYRFDVTLRHADTGWDHFADRWEVLAPDGSVLGVRELAHPHVDEQPFTRSTTVKIPAEIRQVTVRGRDSVHEFGGDEMVVDMP